MLIAMTYLYDVSVDGVANLVKHVTIDDDTVVTTEMVSDWLLGMCAHVSLRLGPLVLLSSAEQAQVSAAARRIVLAYVAADVLDAAYQPDADEEPAGEPFRTRATAELDALVEAVDKMRMTTGSDNVDYGVVVEFPTPRVTMDMRF